MARRALELHGVELDAVGPLPLGPAVLVSNHVSWLDPLVVASLLPCVPISQLDLARWPVVGGLARELGVVFVARGDARSGLRVLRGAEAVLADGLPVLNFPEGTTTAGDTVLPFRKGLFGVARTLGIPVVPLAISYDPPRLRPWDRHPGPGGSHLARGAAARARAGGGSPSPAWTSSRSTRRSTTRT